MPRSLDITSTKNPLIRRIRALLDPEARKAEARMVVEGVRMLEEVLDAGVPVEVLVYDPHALAGPRGEALLDRARRHGARLVTAAPPVVTAPAEEAVPLLRRHGVRILVADQSGAISYEEADYHAPLAVVLGNEGEGPDPVWRTVAEATVRIPLYGRAESLNVAVAAALLLYEVRRTRPT